MADPTETGGNAVPTLEVSTAITATNQGQLVVVFAWLSLTAGILISAVRVYVRWPSSNSKAGKDDLACALSTALAFVQTAVTLSAVRDGFGRIESEMEDVQVNDIAKVSSSHDQTNPDVRMLRCFSLCE